MTSPHERKNALLARLDQVRGRALELRDRLQRAEARAHQALTSTDFDAAEAAQAEKARVAGELAVAEGQWEALEAAHREVDHERQHAEWRAELEQQRRIVEEQVVVARQHAAEITSLLLAVQAALRETAAADGAANRAHERAHELRVSLGEAQHSRYVGQASGQAAGLQDRLPVLRELARTAVE